MAEKFITMWPVAGWSFGTSGKMREKNGEMTLASQPTAPAFSPMFMMPSHKVITPASGSAISITPSLAESKVPSMMRLKISVSPRNSHCSQRGHETYQEETRPDVIQCHVSTIFVLGEHDCAARV